MYNTSFLCTYKLHDDEEDQDTLYRHEYLCAFELKEYDSDKIMKTLEYIYEKLKNNRDFIEILESHYHYIGDKKNYEIVLQFLFSFHSFNLFHTCLIYLLSDDNTSGNNELNNTNTRADANNTEIYKLKLDTFMKNKKLLIDEISKK